jgi:hypothetical protein
MKLEIGAVYCIVEPELNNSFVGKCTSVDEGNDERGLIYNISNDSAQYSYSEVYLDKCNVYKQGY